MEKMGKLLCVLVALALLAPTALAEGSYWTGEEEGVTLTYWVGLSANAATKLNSYAESPVYQTVMEASGIQLEFIHPATGEESTAFNLMLVSGELPDIIEYNWSSYEGGPQKAIDDGVILPLNDLLETYAPDAYAMMTRTDSIYRQCTTDDGTFYAFIPVVNSTSIPNGNTIDKVQDGPIIRADWLEDLGLEVPQTIEDWTNVLTAFKVQKGAQAPLTFSGITANFLPFSGAFDASTDYYLDEGVVKYGPMEEEYRAFLQQMKDWYDAGLLDPDFASNDSATQTSNLLNGVSGAFTGASGGGVTSINQNGQALDEDFHFVGAPYPITQAGQAPRMAGYSFEVRTSGQAAITTTCEQPEIAARFLNYYYTLEGGLLKNFGVEGETYYRDEEGNVYNTELITNNPEGLTTKQAQAVYSRGDNPSPGPIIKVLEPNAVDGNNALALWFTISEDVLKSAYPSAATYSSDEAMEIAMLEPNISAYREEMFVKFIMGTADLETEWDGYVEYLKTLGVERALEIRQAAVDRYNER